MRYQGRTTENEYNAMNTPLLDVKPSDPSTLMTKMLEVQRVTKNTGQSYTIIVCDQQLYKVLVDNKLAYPGQFSKFVLKLGGMYLLMSFIGYFGTLMASKGLEELLKKEFTGGRKMLKGGK